MQDRLFHTGSHPDLLNAHRYFRYEILCQPEAIGTYHSTVDRYIFLLHERIIFRNLRKEFMVMASFNHG